MRLKGLESSSFSLSEDAEDESCPEEGFDESEPKRPPPHSMDDLKNFISTNLFLAVGISNFAGEKKKKKKTSVRQILEQIDKKYVQVEMRPDGNCLFRALSDQLDGDHGIMHEAVRRRIVNHMRLHKAAFSEYVGPEDFPLLPAGTTEELDPVIRFDIYLEQMSLVALSAQDSERWGGDLELRAAAHAYDAEVRCIKPGQPDLVYNEGKPKKLVVAHVGANHYDSLRPAPETAEPPPPVPGPGKELLDADLGPRTDDLDEALAWIDAMTERGSLQKKLI